MFEDIRVGDEVFYKRMVQEGFTSLWLWEIVKITRITKTLIIVGDLRFKIKYCFGVDLYGINEETKQEAERDNSIVRHRRLCSEFWNYKWDKVALEKLLQIESVLNDL